MLKKLCFCTITSFAVLTIFLISHQTFAASAEPSGLNINGVLIKDQGPKVPENSE